MDPLRCKNLELSVTFSNFFTHFPRAAIFPILLPPLTNFFAYPSSLSSHTHTTTTLYASCRLLLNHINRTAAHHYTTLLYSTISTSLLLLRRLFHRQYRQQVMTVKEKPVYEYSEKREKSVITKLRMRLNNLGPDRNAKHTGNRF